MAVKGIKTKACSICGEEFVTSVPLQQYLYKRHRNGKHEYYCSYKCWHKAGGDSEIYGKNKKSN